MDGIKGFLILVIGVLLFSCVCSLICADKKDLKFINVIIAVYIFLSVTNMFGNSFNGVFYDLKQDSDEMMARIKNISISNEKMTDEITERTEYEND